MRILLAVVAAAFAAAAWRFGVGWALLGTVVAIPVGFALLTAGLTWSARARAGRSPHARGAIALVNRLSFDVRRGDAKNAATTFTYLRAGARRNADEPMVLMALFTGAMKMPDAMLDDADRAELLDDVTRALDARRPPERQVCEVLLRYLDHMRGRGDERVDERRRVLEARLLERAPDLRASDAPGPRP